MSSYFFKLLTVIMCYLKKGLFISRDDSAGFSIAAFILFNKGTEGSAAITGPLIAGLGMYGNDSPRELNFQVCLEMI